MFWYSFKLSTKKKTAFIYFTTLAVRTCSLNCKKCRRLRNKFNSSQTPTRHPPTHPGFPRFNSIQFNSIQSRGEGLFYCFRLLRFVLIILRSFSSSKTRAANGSREPHLSLHRTRNGKKKLSANENTVWRIFLLLFDFIHH